MSDSSDPNLVGGWPRPPRILTAGRRRSDRFVAWSLGLFLVACSVFVLFTGWIIDSLADEIRVHVVQCQMGGTEHGR